MLFNSYIFIIGFLPVVLLFYYLLIRMDNRYYAKAFLVLASLFFYSYWEIAYLPILLTTIIFNFVVSKLMNKTEEVKRKKTLLIIGIIFNVGLLCYFKYMDFFIININNVFESNLSLLGLALPLGLSFITFQKIAFLVDTYRGETKGYHILDYAFFVTFFPQLISGPIVHHKEIIPQITDRKNFLVHYNNIASGLYIFAVGLFKKVIIADTFAKWANEGYNNVANLGLYDSWITTLSYTIQLYFDFSGYCDMAIGLALLFNIRLPINFNSPYKSLDIQDFWRRWHMTLGRFFTQYVYIPLGGSRRGKARTYINIFIIFFLSGFWHGAGWTFIIWGAMHGIASVICRFWKGFNIPLPKIVAWFITFLFVHIAWVFFRAPDVVTAKLMIHNMFNFSEFVFPPGIATLLNEWLGTSFTTTIGYYFNLNMVIWVGAAILFVVTAKNSIEKMELFKPTYTNAIIISLMTVASLLYLTRVSEFLYFNF
ncbi:MBOAT family O-acyltransferase [Bacillaceae bacterium CLA-AA-H227]|uniref:MBOAT family O-acyltransferase n=1 Tax=Robertmurraya yapensis (ex Hitch et al 2024) TaxID=3133160 RepID=A0ACC6SEX0_9BACI